MAKTLSPECLLRQVKPQNVIKESFSIGRDMREVTSDTILRQTRDTTKSYMECAIPLLYELGHFAFLGPT